VFGSRLPAEPSLLVTDRLELTLLEPADAPRVADYVRRNHDHLAPWEPPRPVGFEDPAFWEAQLELNRAEMEAGTALRLFLVGRGGGRRAPVLGSCNFFNVVRGAFQACHLGYSLDEGQQGRGLMTEACRAGLDFVFDAWNLHRVMANYRPTNEPSGRLLRRLGFVVEGYARDYLFIDGAWRDHILTSLTNPRHDPVRLESVTPLATPRRR
jgi:ribosomal-protein-alanine N-acetyltransferase